MKGMLLVTKVCLDLCSVYWKLSRLSYQRTFVSRLAKTLKSDKSEGSSD